MLQASRPPILDRVSRGARFGEQNQLCLSLFLAQRNGARFPHVNQLLMDNRCNNLSTDSISASCSSSSHTCLSERYTFEVRTYILHRHFYVLTNVSQPGGGGFRAEQGAVVLHNGLQFLIRSENASILSDLHFRLGCLGASCLTIL